VIMLVFACSHRPIYCASFNTSSVCRIKHLCIDIFAMMCWCCVAEGRASKEGNSVVTARRGMIHFQKN
jgi:hypothetical protein